MSRAGAAVERRAKPGLDLIEEGLILLRKNPVALCGNYIGTVPFLLALLFYCTDMSRSAFAAEHVGSGSLLLAVLFIWMKSWQAFFMSSLRMSLSGEAAERIPWTVRRIVRMLVIQSVIQPTALIARPIALLVTLPYGWVRAFYENAILYGDGTESSVREVVRRAATQAKLWPKQNHGMLVWLTMVLLVLWLNVVSGMATLPALLKMFFGIETPFSRSLSTLLNSTFFGVSFAATYALMNPITKAAYVLRCFYGESLKSGEDLKLRIRNSTERSRGALVAICVGAILAGGTIQAAAAPSAPPQVSATQIDKSVEEVLARREFAWRSPRTASAKAEKSKSWLVRWIDSAIETIRHILKPVKAWATSVMEWIMEKLFARKARAEEGNLHPAGWAGAIRVAAWALMVVAVGAFGVIWFRRWKKGKRRKELVADALPAVPDLTREDVSAAQLPEDGWLELAREMQARGDLRLALRALYLAGLAHLGARELISIARHKSNRDYSRELSRRARDRQPLLEAFGLTVHAFERTWYGLHEATEQGLDLVRANMERIRTS